MTTPFCASISFLAAALGAGAQGPVTHVGESGSLVVVQQETACKSCDGHGTTACRKCARRKAKACSGSAARFCSAVAGCKSCGGTGREDCRRCDTDKEEDLTEIRVALPGWLKGRRAVDEYMGHELVHLESRHFVLVYDIDRISPERRALDRHAGAHLYLERLEAFRRDFVADLGAEPEKDFYEKTTVMLWQKEKHQVKASEHYTRQPSNTESKLMGAAPVVSIFYNKSHLHEEFELHQAVVHQVAHCLLSNVFDGIWPGNIKGGWIDGGLAHAYEVRYFGGVRHYCYVESDSMVEFKYGHWQSSVRNAVDRDEELAFLEVAARHTSELTPEQHMFAWSFVDYCLRGRPGTFGALARGS